MRKTSYTLLFLIGMLNMLWAQLPVTLNTTVGSTNYTGTNSCGTGAAGTCFITFVVENSSSNAIIIEEVGQWTSTANNGNSVDLYVTSTLLSGPVAGTFIPSSPPAGWTLAASGTIGGITTTQVNPVLTGLSILVPANTTYRFNLVPSGTVSYSGTGVGTCTPNSFTDPGSNVFLRVGDHTIASNWVGYGGVNGPRFFTGSIKYKLAVSAANDAGVSAIDTPSAFVLGTTPIAARIRNYGLNQITSADINWSINGVTQTTVPWVGFLDTLNGSGPNTAVVSLGSTSFSLNTPYVIKAWTSFPNGLADTVPVNDTFTRIYRSPLNGGYTIGQVGADFVSIKQALEVMAVAGVSGPVEFKLIDTLYNTTTGETFPLLLTTVPGMSSVNTVTFKPDSGVVVSIVANTANIFNISNARNFIIDGRWHPSLPERRLTITNTNTTGVNITLQNEAINNTIRYCIIRSANSGTASGALVFLGSSGVIGNDSNTIANNLFTRSTAGNYQIGIFSQGASNIVQNNNNTIIANEFNSFAFNGINITSTNNGNGSNWLISENHFYDTSFNTAITGTWSAINFNPGAASGSANNRIENNFIGGSAPFNAGTALTGITNTTRVMIQVTTAIGIPNSVKGNIIRNFYFPVTANTSQFTGIQVSSGFSVIDSNTIDSILNLQNSVIIGINYPVTSNQTITRNIIKTITHYNASTTGAIRGITISGGQVVNISNNIIKGFRSNGTNTGQNISALLIGISSQSSSNTVTIANNQIGTLIEPLRSTHNSTSNVCVQGIVVNQGTHTIYGNTIDGLFVDSTAQSSLSTTTGATINGILNSSATSGQIIRRNNVRHLYQRSSATTQTSQINGICYASSGFHTIDSNIVYGFFSRSTNTGTSTSSALNGINIGSSGRCLVQYNYVDSLALTRATATTGVVNGILVFGSGGNRVAFNKVSHLYMNMTTSAPAICGIQYVSAIVNQECEGNEIWSLTNTNPTATGSIVGIRYFSAATVTGNASFCNRNLVHSFRSTATSSMTMTGLEMASGSATFANNVVRMGIDTAGNGFTGPYAINGLLCSVAGATQPVRVYHNTLFVGGAPTTGSQITAAFHCNSQPLIDARNNIFVNLVQNSGSTGTNFASRYAIQPLAGSNVNYNLLWAGTFTNNFIGGGYFTNTNTMYGAAGMRYAGRIETSGSAVNPGLINPTGSLLNMNLSLPNLNPGAGQGDTSLVDPITIDFLGNNRSARTPVDIGAFSLATDTLTADSIGPELIVPVLTNTASIANRTISVTIFDRTSGIAGGAVSPRIYFNKNGGLYQFTNGTLVSGNHRLGTWEFTIDYALLSGVIPNDVIRYYVIAQDSAGIVTSNPANAVAPSVDIVINNPITPNQYTITTPIATSITVGPTGNYPTLTGAGGLFAAINNSMLQGNTIVLLESGTITENGANPLNQWLEFNTGSGTLGNFGYTLTIRPATNTQTVLTGGVTTADGMIRLNGADRVTILGYSPSGTTADTNLLVRNTATSQPCLTFLNDATNNSIINVVFETANTGTAVTTGGAVRISQTSAVTGNDNITMTGCHLRWVGTGTVAGILFAASGTTGVNRENDNLLIENCTFYNFNFNAIQISTGTGNNQVIKNNRFFQMQGVYHTSSPTVINFTPGGLSNNDTISGNVIGGATFVLDTSNWYPSISSSLAFTGISVSAGAVTGTYIANNRIANIQHAYRSGTTYAGTFTGILVNSGGGVAYVVNNYIGDTLLPDNILHSGNTTTLPISCQTASNSFINNNIIANITNNNPNSTSVIVNGIRAWNQTATLQINNNIILNLKDSSASTGSTTGAPMVGINISSATNSIQVDGNFISNLANNSLTPASTSQVLGIYSSSGLPVITNNIVEKLLSRTLNTSSTTGATLIGIWSQSNNPGQTISNNIVRELTYNNPSPASTQTIGIYQSSGSGHTISGNQVYSLKSNSSSSNTGASASIIGIMQTGGGTSFNITDNRVYNLENINTTGVLSNIVGIMLQNATTAVYTNVSRNFIHSFKANSTSSARMVGIHYNSGSFVRFTNNMIRLGIDSAGTPFAGPYEVNGLLNETVGNFDYFHNSIYIGGAPSSGSSITAAIRITGTPTGTQNFDFRNNILVNATSNTGTASAKHYGLRIAAIPTNPTSIVSNYNIFSVTGVGGFIAGTNLVDYPNLTLINGWKTLTGYDLQSGSGNPQFVDATGTADVVDLHLQSLNPAEGSADPSLASVVTFDFDGQTRSSQTPSDIGADAGNFTITSDLISPVITFTPLSNQGNLSGPLPLANVNIRDNLGVPLTGNTPRLYYRKGSAGIYTSVGHVSQTGTSTDANFTFEIDYNLISGVVTGDTIFYYVIAEDSASGNIMSTAPYAVASNVNTVAQHPLLPNSYTFLPVIPAGTKFYVGSGQPYTTLTGAGGLFEFLNNSTIGGSISAVITSNITEPGTIQLNQIGEDGPGAGSYTFTIQPDSSAVTPRIISGAVGTLGMLVLNGADRVKITGIPDQITNTTLRNLTIRNTNGPVVNFINGAQQCRLTNLTLESGNGSAFNAVNQGVVSFAGTNNSFGNSQDSITNCIIRNNTAATLPLGIPQVLVGSYHTGLTLNANNVVTGNLMSNAAAAFVNVEIGSGNGWIVSNNDMFCSVSSVLTTIPLAIRFNGGILSDGHTINNNVIGGTAVNAGGAPWTTNVFAGWNHIQLAVGLNQTTHVTGNIIRNISWPQTGSGNQWNGIIATTGRLNISNNMIGDSTVAGSIFLAAPTTHNAIVINGTVTSPVTISGNRFAGISVVNPGNSIGLNAINMAGGIATVSNNIIGATSVPNTILHDGNSVLRGIVLSTPVNLDPSTQVTNNTIANMTSIAAMPSASVGGIQQSGTTVSNISGNRIFNLSSSAANSTLSVAPSAFGIGVSAVVNPGMTVNNNTIYNISAANTDPIVTNSFGIAVQSANSMIVAGNRIYDIRNLSSAVAQNPTAVAAGIVVFSMQNKIDIMNNQVTLGNAQANNIQYNGIWQNTSGGFDVNSYYNTVLITGASTSGNIPSFAYHRGSNSSSEITSTTRLFNNAFINNRTGGSTKNYAIANELAGTPLGSGWQESGYNLLSSTAATTVGLWGTSDRDIAQWRASSNADRTSWSVTSSVLNPSAVFTDVVNGNLNIVTTVPQNWYFNGKGIAGALSANINSDFSGNVRGTTVGFGTDIGAHEFNSTSIPPAMTVSGNIAYNTANTLSFASRDIATITWAGIGTLPSSLSAQYYSATTPPNSFPAARHLNAYMQVAASGGTGYFYDISLNYDLALLGNVISQTDLKVARNASGTWSVDNTSVANTILRTVTNGAPFNGFGAITATDATSPLPVEMLSFEGRAIGNDAVLNWATASEVNSAAFEIERSFDAVNFEYVTSVSAKGNKTSRTDYTATDAGALASNNTVYYRLKQVDNDGSFTYSSVVRVSKAVLNNSQVTVYPNPFEGGFNVSIFSTQSGTANASVIDLQGRSVMNFSWFVNEGANVMPVDAATQLQKGVYFIRIDLNGETTTLKVINLK